MSSTQLSKPHLLGIKDITEDDIQLIFNTSREFKEVINTDKRLQKYILTGMVLGKFLCKMIFRKAVGRRPDGGGT